MRSESEKKSIVKSIKLSPLQEQQIKEQADKKGMKFSEYMLDCALHSNQGITPQIAVKMQEMIIAILKIITSDQQQKTILCNQKARL